MTMPERARASAIAPGYVIAGRYVLEAAIGEGGMGAVYRARPLADGPPVAVKVLKERSPEYLTRFLREAKLMASLEHPRIVKVHEVLTLDDETPVLVMDLLTGESLASRLRRSERLSLLELAPIFLQLLAAIRAAHARGVVHRDLKPDNVFLCASGSAVDVKVLDFGIAKITVDSEDPPVTAAALTGTGHILGTPQYMAPEQIFGEREIDPRADVWALGVILYECLSGTRPFEGENVGQIFKAIALEPPRPLAARAPWVSAHVSDLVMRMLVHSRSERLSDLAEVEATLTNEIEHVSTLAGAPTLPAWAAAAPAPLPPAPPPTAPKGRSTRLVVVALLVLTGSATGYATFVATRPRPPLVAPAATVSTEQAPAPVPSETASASASASPPPGPAASVTPTPSRIKGRPARPQNGRPSSDAHPDAAPPNTPNAAPTSSFRSGGLRPDDF
jgi:serine/threonine protein kinase